MRWKREHTGWQFPGTAAWTCVLKSKTTMENEGAGGERGIPRPFPGKLMERGEQGGSPACPGAPVAALAALTAPCFGKHRSQPPTQARVGRQVMSPPRVRAKVSSLLAPYCSLACKWFLFVLTLSHSICCILSAALNLC